jgi:hypothetical protein
MRACKAMVRCRAMTLGVANAGPTGSPTGSLSRNAGATGVAIPDPAATNESFFRVRVVDR